MRVDDVRRFVGVVGSSVPNHELLVVGDGAEERFVQQMPRDVLHHGRVPVVDRKSVQNTIISGSAVDVPQANRVVIGGRQQISIQVGIPRETVSWMMLGEGGDQGKKEFGARVRGWGGEISVSHSL